MKNTDIYFQALTLSLYQNANLEVALNLAEEYSQKITAGCYIPELLSVMSVHSHVQQKLAALELKSAASVSKYAYLQAFVISKNVTLAKSIAISFAAQAIGKKNFEPKCCCFQQLEAVEQLSQRVIAGVKNKLTKDETLLLESGHRALNKNCREWSDNSDISKSLKP